MPIRYILCRLKKVPRSNQMCEIKLYNFYIGDLGNVNKPQYEEKRFGSLKVRFCGDYMEQITQLKQMEKHKCVRGFIHTADLLVDKNAKKQQKSILLETPSDDNGIFDFLELATFFTGRRVVAGDGDMEKYYSDIQITNNGCNDPLCALYDAWENRHCLVDSKIGMALLLMNSVRSNILQSMVYHYASAMEIIQTQLSKTGDPLDINHADIKQADKNTLKEAINKILKNSTFSDDLKKSYTRIIGNSIDRGLKGPQYHLLSALIKLAILEGEPGKKTEIAIKTINDIRNKIIHTGKFPTIPIKNERNVSQEEGMRMLADISKSIIPGFCIIAICKTLKLQEIYYDCYIKQVKHIFEQAESSYSSIEGLFTSKKTT